jgi:hypothetical protein
MGVVKYFFYSLSASIRAKQKGINKHISMKKSNKIIHDIKHASILPYKIFWGK